MRFFALTLSVSFFALLCAAPFARAEDEKPAVPPPLYDSSPPAPVTPAFEEMLSHVYEASPQLKAQRDSLGILDERAAQAVSGFRPTLSITGSEGEQRTSTNSSAWIYGQDQQLSLTAIQPLYNGATWGQWRAAKSRVQAGRNELLATEQKLFLAAITAWLELCEKQKLLDLNQNNLQLMQAHSNATDERLKAGDSTQTDVAVAESRLADAMARVSLAEATRDAARATYEHVTGLHAQATHFLPLPGNLPRSREESLTLIQKNPEYQEAQEAIDAADNDIETAIGAREPNIFLQGQMSQQNAPDLGLARLRTDSITINLSLPLYQGGLEYSREREAKIAYRKSEQSAIDVSRGLHEQMQQAWDNFRAAQEVIKASQKAVDASGRALDGIQEEQKRGTRTLTEVLDAQSQLLGAQVTEVQAEKNVRLEAYRLLTVCGRLTAKDLNLPTKIYDPTQHYDEVTSRWFGVTPSNTELTHE